MTKDINRKLQTGFFLLATAITADGIFVSTIDSRLHV